MQWINTLERRLEAVTRLNPWTNVYGLARSLLALGLLLTLLANANSTLLPTIDGRPVNTILDSLAGIYQYNFFLLFGPAYFPLMKVLAMLILLLCVAGFSPRYTCLLHWWIASSFIVVSSAVDGGDQIAANLTMLLVPICLLDNRWNHWARTKDRRERPIAKLIAFSSFWMIRLQVAVIYFHAATGKFTVTEWANGTAVYYWFNHTFFRMPDWLEVIVQPLLANAFVVSAVTWGAMLLELVLFLCLTLPEKRRRPFLYLGLSFHFSILIIHGLVSFFCSISAGLILFLYPVYRSLHFPRPAWRPWTVFQGAPKPASEPSPAVV